jgi:acyl-CoA reductase-like NAD-dependent aldehyde dehydrogenase
MMFKFKALIEEHMQEHAHLMSSEHGKLLDDSNGELQRGLEVAEFVCGTQLSATLTYMARTVSAFLHARMS